MNLIREGPGHIYTLIWFAAPNHTSTNSAFSSADAAPILNGDQADIPEGKIQLCV